MDADDIEADQRLGGRRVLTKIGFGQCQQLGLFSGIHSLLGSTESN